MLRTLCCKLQLPALLLRRPEDGDDDYEQEVEGDEAEYDEDPRQHTLFPPRWTLYSLCP